MVANSKRLEVGTKVRVLHTDYAEIPVGTVTHVVRPNDGAASLWCEKYPEGLFFFSYEFEVIADDATNDAPKFAVGDRVRVVKYGGEAGGSRHGAKIGEEFTIERVDEDGVDTEAWYFFNDEIEPVAVAPQQQQLTITAGRYYRTRDGRKVGPAKRNDDAAFPWNVPHGGFYGYTADGKSCLCCNEDDLIAEWVDEPAATNADIFDDLEDWMADNPLPVIDTSTTGFTVPLDAPEFGGKLDATAPTLDDLYAAKCMVETGVCTINEVRKHLGLGPVPRGHELARAA